MKPLPSQGPTTGRHCYVTPAFSAISLQKGRKSKEATSPLASRRPKIGYNCYITTIILRGPPKRGQNHKWLHHPSLLGERDWVELLHNPFVSGVPRKGDKITSGYITPAFSGAEDWAELLSNPSALGDPQKQGQNQKRLHHPYLLGGPRLGGIAT